MSYRLQRSETVAEGVRRIAREQIDRGLAELVDPDLGPHEAVHQVRKRCKKLRGLMRLVRGGALGEAPYQAENARYRDAARRLSSLRDAGALLETYDRLMECYGGEIDRRAFGPVRAALTNRRKRLARDEADLAAGLDEMRAALEAGRARLDSLPLKKNGYARLAPGLTKTYDRAREAMGKAADKPTDARLHEWRKRVKYHWYHTRILEGAWRAPLKARSQQLRTLSDLLGDDHDLAVFRDTLMAEDGLVTNPVTADALLALVARRRQMLQHRAFRLGRRLFAEKTGRFSDRMEGYWDVWRDGNHRTPAEIAVEKAA